MDPDDVRGALAFIVSIYPQVFGDNRRNARSGRTAWGDCRWCDKTGEVRAGVPERRGNDLLEVRPANGSFGETFAMATCPHAERLAHTSGLARK